jgi:hypothetical protein
VRRFTIWSLYPSPKEKRKWILDLIIIFAHSFPRVAVSFGIVDAPVECGRGPFGGGGLISPAKVTYPFHRRS